MPRAILWGVVAFGAVLGLCLSAGLLAQAAHPGAPVCSTLTHGAVAAVSQPSPQSPSSCSLPTTTIGPYGCVYGHCIVPQITLPSGNPLAWLGYLGCVITGVVEIAFGVVFSSLLWVVTWIENGLSLVAVYLLSIPQYMAVAVSRAINFLGLLGPPVAVLLVGVLIVVLTLVVYLVFTLTKLLIDML